MDIFEVDMRVVAAMSGGVDSSVAALLLKERGLDVVGITIKTWPKEECGLDGEKLCCSLEAVQYARSVAEDIDIPFYVVDFSEDFAREVKEYFADEYSRGRTPNPCIYCNSRIKFGSLLRKARELGAEKVATGHYARIINRHGSRCLAEGVDRKKDQSYFLYDIPSSVLSSVEFPLGCLTKDRVTEMAYERGFMSASRPSSQDICFASAKGGYREYLKGIRGEAFEPGDILDVEGRVIGQHQGIAAYTVGQRKGLGLSGPDPYYVIKIDPEKNTITLGTKEHTMSSKIRVGGFNWLTIDRLTGEKEVDVKIRYNSPRCGCSIIPTADNEAIVHFRQSQFAPTPGQAAVFYEGEVVMGGGWIEEVLD